MCGIVGIVSNCSNGFSQKETAVFAQLVFLDTVRGFDSTGVFGVHNNHNVVIHKDAVNGLDFLQTKEFKEFKSEMFQTGKVMVGHNRAATRGTVVDKNAHPFWVDDKIVLVQNGTYKGDHKHLKDTDVDTDAVAHVIAAEPTVEGALQKINASYALVWYNAETFELNLIRNSERPLFIAKFFNHGLVFASEGSMIQYAAAREDLKLTGLPEEIPADTHVVIKLDGKGGYTRTDTNIDARYRFPHNATNDVEEANWYQPWHHGRRWARSAVADAIAHVDANPTLRPGVLGKNDVKQTFAETIIKEAPRFLFSSKEEAIADIDAINEQVYQGHHYVEMLDYFPANDKADCCVWHVYGSILGDKMGNKDSTTLVHWIVYDMVESDVLDMCTNMFYKVKLSTTITRRIVVGNNEEKWLNSVFASEHEEIQGVTS